MKNNIPVTVAQEQCHIIINPSNNPSLLITQGVGPCIAIIVRGYALDTDDNAEDFIALYHWEGGSALLLKSLLDKQNVNHLSSLCIQQKLQLGLELAEREISAFINKIYLSFPYEVKELVIEEMSIIGGQKAAQHNQGTEIQVQGLRQLLLDEASKADFEDDNDIELPEYIDFQCLLTKGEEYLDLQVGLSDENELLIIKVFHQAPLNNNPSNSLICSVLKEKNFLTPSLPNSSMPQERITKKPGLFQDSVKKTFLPDKENSPYAKNHHASTRHS